MVAKKDQTPTTLDLGHKGYIVMIPFVENSSFKDKASGWPTWARDNKMWYSPDYFQRGPSRYNVDSGEWASPATLVNKPSGFRGTLCADLARALSATSFANSGYAVHRESNYYSHPEKALAWHGAHVHPLSVTVVPTEITENERRLLQAAKGSRGPYSEPVRQFTSLTRDFIAAASKQDSEGLFFAWVPLQKQQDGSFTVTTRDIDSAEAMQFLTGHRSQALDRYQDATHLGAVMIKPGKALSPDQIYALTTAAQPGNSSKPAPKPTF